MPQRRSTPTSTLRRVAADAVAESPEFTQTVKKKIELEQSSKSKFTDIFIHHWQSLLVVLNIAIGFDALTYTFKTHSLAYMEEFQHVSANVASGTVMVADIIFLATVPLFRELCVRVR